MKTASIYKALLDDDKQFLSAIAKEVATLVAVSNNMNHFQKQLTEFSDKWKAYKTAYEADRKRKWQPSMGKPKNPLGTIWPLIYGSGWRDGVEKCFPEKRGIISIRLSPCRDIKGVLGAYALLGVIHDNILPQCPPIAKDVLPKKLSQEIWRNLVTGIDVEGQTFSGGDEVSQQPRSVIRRGKIMNFLIDVRADIGQDATPLSEIETLYFNKFSPTHRKLWDAEKERKKERVKNGKAGGTKQGNQAIMLDGKIFDRARRLIECRFAERRKALSEEVERIMGKLGFEGCARSSGAFKLVRDACEEEIRTKAEIVWDSIQEVHKALGSSITETLATALKQEVGYHVEAIVEEISKYMIQRLPMSKSDAHYFDFENIKREVKEKFDVEVDLYVDSLLCIPAETGQKIKPAKEPPAFAEEPPKPAETGKKDEPCDPLSWIYEMYDSLVWKEFRDSGEQWVGPFDPIFRFHEDTESLTDILTLKDCITHLKKILPYWIEYEFVSPKSDILAQMTHTIRCWLIKVCHNSNQKLPPIPPDLIGMVDWITGVEKILDGGTTRKETDYTAQEQSSKHHKKTTETEKEERGKAKVLKGQVELNTENTLNSELKSLSEKIRQYRAGKGVPDKPLYLTGMKGRLQLGPDGDLKVIPAPDYEAAYEDAWDQALNIMQKFAGLTEFTELPKNKLEPMIGLRYLEEWCYTNSRRVADEHFKLPAETKHGRLQQIIEVLKNWQKLAKKDKDPETAKSALPPIAETYDILCRLRGQCGAKTTNIISWLGSATQDGSGYYLDLLNELAHPEVIADLEKWQKNKAEAETQEKGGQSNNEITKQLSSVKEPSKEAQQAYKLYYSGMTQKEVAKKMTNILKRPVSQGQVSRLVNEYKKWRKAEGISVDDKKPNIITNSDILDMGARTDGRITGDPRHKKDTDYGDNDKS